MSCAPLCSLLSKRICRRTSHAHASLIPCIDTGTLAAQPHNRSNLARRLVRGDDNLRHFVHGSFHALVSRTNRVRTEGAFASKRRTRVKPCNCSAKESWSVISSSSCSFSSRHPSSLTQSCPSFPSCPSSLIPCLQPRTQHQRHWIQLNQLPRQPRRLLQRWCQQPH